MKRSAFLILFLLLFISATQANSWGKRDEQYKYGQKKLPIKGDDSKSGENILEVEENLSSEEVKSSNYPIETSRSIVRQNMDNIARDMRYKTLSKMYQGSDIQEPIEQISSYSDSGNSGDAGSQSNEEGNIQLAVKSKRKYEFVPFHYDREEMKTPRLIEIVSDTMPLRLHFKSQSAAIVVTQSHMSPPMKAIEEKVTMDEPYRLSHEVHKPIVQTVREIIQPYRNIFQQIKPAIEDIRTIVPKDSDALHNHMSGTNSTKSNDWAPVPNIKRPAIKARPLPRPSPAQQLQNRYSRPTTQMLEGVKTSESRSRMQRRAHYDESRGSTPMSQHQFKYNQDKNVPMQYGSSQQEILYVPMYSFSDQSNNNRPAHFPIESDSSYYSETENNLNHLSDYINQLKKEESQEESGENQESSSPPGSISDTLSRSKRHNILPQVQCSEIGCEVTDRSYLPSWLPNDSSDNDFDRHYF